MIANYSEVVKSQYSKEGIELLRIYVGNDEPPSNTIGRNGDLYFVIP